MSKKSCACHENCDARECLLRRSPGLRRNSDEPGTLAEDGMDEKCECPCHREEAEFEPEPWEANP